MDEEEEYEAMKLVWENLASKVANTDGWTENDRHYKTMMEATYPNKFGKKDPLKKKDPPLFTASTLAFVAVLYMGNYDKWMAMHRWMKDHPSQKLPENTKENRAKEEHANYRDMFICPFIKMEAGQKGDHGWTDEGLKRFAELQKEFKELLKNKKEDMEKVDKDFLKRLRKELGLDANNADQEKKNKRKRKRSGLAEEKKADDVATFDANELDF